MTKFASVINTLEGPKLVKSLLKADLLKPKKATKSRPNLPRKATYLYFLR